MTISGLAHPMPLHFIMRPSFPPTWTPLLPRGTISVAVPDNPHRHRRLPLVSRKRQHASTRRPHVRGGPRFPTWPRRPRLIYTCHHALFLRHVSPHTPRDPLQRFLLCIFNLINQNKGSRTNEIKSSLFVRWLCVNHKEPTRRHL